MQTELGKFLQKIRNNKHITQRDMAISLGLTPAFLSYIENGYRHTPLGIEFKIAQVLSLSSELKEELNRAVDKTRKMVILQVPEQEEDRFLLGDFCRHFNTLTTEQKSKISEILNE